MTGTEKNRIVFEEMPVGKALSTLAVPTIIGQMIILIYNMADTYFIGRTGDPVMVAAVSLILPLFNVTVAVANMVGNGGGTLISRLLGSGEEEEARRVAGFSFVTSVCLAAVFAGSVGLGLRPLLVLMGASSATLEYAAKYTLITVVIGGVPTIMSMTMANLLRGVGDAKHAGFGISLGGISNIILDPVFMFVILPEGMEVVGAAVATLISNFIACGFFFTVIARQRKISVLELIPRHGMPKVRSIGEIFSVGVPAAIAMFLFDVDYVVIDKLASTYSDVALAAVGIVLKVERFPLNMGIGLCQGMMPLAGYNYAARNLPRMKKALNYSRYAGLVVAALSVVVYEIFAIGILHFFIDDPETATIGANFLRIRIIATPLMFLSFHLSNFFQAIGKGGTAFILIFARWALFNIPMLFILNSLFGMYGIVWSQFFGDVLTVIASLVVYAIVDSREFRRGA